MFGKSSFTASALIGLAAAQADLTFTSNNSFKLKHAAFINMGKFEDSTENFLLVSSFAAMGNGNLYIVPGVTDAVKASDASGLKPVKLDTATFQWPNNVEVIPWDVFGERAIVVPDGFLVPGHKNGAVYVVRMDSEDLTKTVETVSITAPKADYFYHMGYWVDLNGDGRKDFITARSNAVAGQGELLWLEHPESGLDSTDPWTEHVLGNIADVSIEVQELSEYKGEIVVFAA